MSDACVVFDGVWKKFRRGQRHDTLRDLIPALAKRAVARAKAPELESDEFWAVKDVSFEVRRGEAFGIMGSNGAGKSTTLKLLTKIMRPTRGQCQIHGRLGALIELAAGFHPDLTGRENVFLQGAIMGMKRAEISRKLDAIVDFAGVSDFIDTPVKRYSSGMNARLGFSIAAHLDPEVLLIDEVLAVGDMAFQRKCFNRMQEFCKSGAAIVFISHNLEALRLLCPKGMVLDRGRVAFAGSIGDCIHTYTKEWTAASATDDDTRPPVEMVSAELTGTGGRAVEQVTPGDMLQLQVTYRANRAANKIAAGLALFRQPDSLCVYDSQSHLMGLPPFDVAAGQEFTVSFVFRANLLRGLYDLVGTVYDVTGEYEVDQYRRLASFVVSETTARGGIAHLEMAAASVDTRQSELNRQTEWDGPVRRAAVTIQ